MNLEKPSEELITLYGLMYIALDMLENCPEFAPLIPEVRTNLVFAKSDAKSPMDVLAIEGRITVVDAKPKATGRIKFGASDHMARFIIEVRKTDPNIRAGINLRGTPDIVPFLRNYAEKHDYKYGFIDRSLEPEEMKREEIPSMPWKVSQAIKTAGGVPRIAWEFNGLGKEDVSVILGSDPVDVVIEACKIAKELWEKLVK